MNRLFVLSGCLLALGACVPKEPICYMPAESEVLYTKEGFPIVNDQAPLPVPCPVVEGITVDDGGGNTPTPQPPEDPSTPLRDVGTDTLDTYASRSSEDGLLSESGIDGTVISSASSNDGVMVARAGDLIVTRSTAPTE